MHRSRANLQKPLKCKHGAVFLSWLTYFALMVGVKSFSHVKPSAFTSLSFTFDRYGISNPLPTRKTTGLGVSSMPSDLNPDFALEVVEKIQDAVVIVSPIGIENKTALGSGFLINFASSSYNDLGTMGSMETVGEVVGGDTGEYLFILTAAHVAAPGYKIQVRFPFLDDVPPIAAKVIGRQMTTDLALLRISRSDLYPYAVPPTLKITTRNQVGELAFACGYPIGLLTTEGPALTMGIICGLAPGLASGGSKNYEENNIENVNIIEKEKQNLQTSSNTMFVVTDAAMAKGMSGGPLVNNDGEIIGMNCLVRSDLRSLGNYAITSSTIIPFLQRLQKLYYEKMNENIYGTKAGGVVEPGAELVQETEPQNYATEISEKYRVILYKFNPNKQEAVSKILQERLLYTNTEAEKIISNTVSRGYAILEEFQSMKGKQNRDEAFALCNALRQENLLVEVEKVNA